VSWWKRFIPAFFTRPKRRSQVLVIGTAVIAKTKSGAFIRGTIRSITRDHSDIGVLMAGLVDVHTSYLWFKGKDLTIDTSVWDK